MDNNRLNVLQNRRKELGYTYRELSELCSIPVSTVQKIFGGYVPSPRRETLEKLEAVLLKKDEKYSYAGTGEKNGAGVLRDAGMSAAPAYDLEEEESEYDAKQGHHTLEDYFALPDDRRVELIDGYFYDMAAPTSIHQVIASEIFVNHRDFVKKNKGSCVPLISPIDVQLFEDGQDIVQPDAIIVCDRNKIHKHIIGAPDLVVEVLSPSNTYRLVNKKLMKYRAAGVREYWEIDPEEETVQVYLFDPSGKAEISIYTFADTVPVSIWDGQCKVDFREIRDYLQELAVDEK